MLSKKRFNIESSNMLKQVIIIYQGGGKELKDVLRT